MLLLVIGGNISGQAVFYQESFEGVSGYSFPNGNGGVAEDFFDRTDLAGAPSTETFNYTGFDGNYFIAGEDIDGELSGSTGIVSISGIDITGITNLEFTAAFASGTDVDIDEADDAMWVEYRINGGSWTEIGRFEADISSGFNSQFAEDTNGDFVGDGTVLNGTFQDFTWPITGTGSTLDIRISMDLDSGDEEGAVDNVRISGIACQNPITISGFSPEEGSSGTIINLQGSNFQNSGALDSLRINGTLITDYTVNSDTEITLEIPPGASAGSFEVYRDFCAEISSNSFDYKSTTCDASQEEVLIISELCDPNNSFEQERYIEIYNPTDIEISLNGWVLEAYANAGNQTEDMASWVLSGSIGPNEAITCGSSQASTSQGGPHTFTNAGNEWNVYNSGFPGNTIFKWNGEYRDGAALFYNGALIDQVTQGPSDSEWYENSSAVRNPSINTPSTTFVQAQWTVTSVSTAGSGASTPRSHSVNTTIDLAGAPDITSEPTDNEDVALCENPTFSISANSESAESYQWFVYTGSGSNFSAVSGADYTGETSNTLTINDLEGKDSYQFYCRITTSNCSTYSKTVQVYLKTGVAGLWTGEVDDDWLDCRNWDNGRLPDETIDVTIPGGSNPEPVINAGTAKCNSLSIANSKSVSLNNSMAVLEVSGDLNIDGALTASAGELAFAGNNDATLQGSGSITVQDLTIDKTTGNLDITGINPEVNGVLTMSNGIIYMDSDSEYLLMTSGSSVAGPPSNSSFVNGYIRKEGGGDFDFPLGDQGFYQPIGISNLSNSGSTFAARYFVEAHPNSGPYYDGNGELQELGHCDYWSMDRVSGSAEAFITLTFGNTTCNEITDQGADEGHLFLSIARYDGSNWEYPIEEGVDPEPTQISSLSALDDFSDFVITSQRPDLNTLPVEWLFFEARRAGDDAELVWSTASELNNDYFAIERSATGENFEEIDRVEGSGTSAHTSTYRYIDDEPMSGVNYYRVRQVDMNGESESTGIEAVNFDRSELAIISAVHSEEGIVVRYTASGGPVTATLTDAAGRTLYRKEFRNTNGLIRLPRQAQGLYLIELNDGTSRQVRRVGLR